MGALGLPPSSSLGGSVPAKSEVAKHPRLPRLPRGVLFGLVLIFIGIAFLFENLGLIYIEDALQFFPCLIIAFGLARLWSRGFLNVWGQVLAIGGVLLQLAFLGHDEAIEYWWPMLVIWVGVIVILRAFVPKRARIGHGAGQACPRQGSADTAGSVPGSKGDGQAENGDNISKEQAP